MSIWYNGGTLAVESGSASVVGTGTLFATQVKAGDALFIDGTLYQVTVVTDDTDLTIEPVYAGSTASGVAYYILPTSPDWGDVSSVAADLAAFLANRATFFPTNGKPDDGLGGNGSFAVDPNATPPKLYVKTDGTWDNGTSLGGPKGDTGAGYGGTSSDTKTLVSSGSMSFTTQAGLAWQSGSRIRVASATAPTTKWMEGVITSYSSTTLVVTIDKQGSGSGSASDWTFSPAGIPGEKGDTPKLSGTSTDSKTIGTGSVTVATQSDLAFAIGSRVTLASAANSANFMQGLITAYSAGSMTVNIDFVGGSGTFADWIITLVGARGATGPQGLGYGGTSTTSRAIDSSGTMTWTIGTGKAYQVGDLVKIVVTTDVTQWMKGIVSGYSAGVLSVDINEKSPTGSGTFASWNIGLVGETGQQGIQGNPGNNGSDGTSPTYNATSSSTLTPATGSKAFTVASGLSFVAGQRVRAASSANLTTNWMSGIVASYSGTTLTVTVDLIGSSPASAADWVISITGEKGDQGPAGGFGSLTATKGNIPSGDGTTYGAVPVGADGTVPIADSTQTNGWSWQAEDAINAGPYWTASDIASAATCDIGAATTPYVRITGMTTITSLGTAPNRFRFIQFTGSLKLTYNGTSLILPGTANIITQAGDKGIFVSDGSGNWRCICWTPIGFLPREKLSGNRTYYVRPDGSDSNTGLANTAGGAFLTLQKACDVVYGTLDLGGFDVTIQVAAASTPATFTAGVAITSPQVGKGTITLLGDTTTPSNFVISTSGDCISVTGASSTLSIRGFKLTSSAGNCLNANTGGRINFGKIDFGAATSQSHMRFTNAGSIGLISGDDYKISGSAGNHILGLSNGLLAVSSITVTLTGTPAWGTAFANLQGAQASLFSVAFSGSATGPRYSVAGNGLLNSFGAGTASTYFPGNSNGTIASGGQQI